nr:tRNA lysidine(34) synthetase TilS [Oceanococcus sp. HetDA_MAG_MS8]
MSTPVNPVFEGLQLPQAHSYLLGLSGGVDSAALAALLAGRVRLRCVHVNHGLGPHAQELEQAAVGIARTLGLPLQCLQLRDAPNANQEAWARERRYAACAQLLRPGEVLLTAHHAQDQIETWLLAALRGSGAVGLSAMPVLKPFARGWHARPALALPAVELQQQAAGLPWMDDPTNADLELARNRVRVELLPLLEKIHPRSHAALLRSVDLAQQQSRELRFWQQAWIEQHLEMQRQALPLQALQELAAPPREGLLHAAVRSLGAPAIPQRVLWQWLKQMQAPDDRQPALHWSGWSLRRYQGWVYVVPPLPPPPQALAVSQEGWQEWVAGSRVYCPQGQAGTLRGADRTAASLSAGHRSKLRVKRVFSSLGVPPWLRCYWPMLWQGHQLCSVAEWRVHGIDEAQVLRWTNLPEWIRPWVRQAREKPLG